MGLVLALFGATNVYAQSTVELPYSITFDSTNDVWTVLDASPTPGTSWEFNNDWGNDGFCIGNAWTATPSYCIRTDSGEPNDYYVSPSFSLKAGKTYTVKTSSGTMYSTPATLSVEYTTTPTDAASFTKLSDIDMPSSGVQYDNSFDQTLSSIELNTVYDRDPSTFEFSVHESGNYYVAFHISDSEGANAYGYIFDFSLAEKEGAAEEPVATAPVADLAAAEIATAKSVELTWTNPTKDVDGKDLPADAALTVKVYEGEELLATQVAQAPGSEGTYTKEYTADTFAGEHNYKVVVVYKEKESEEATATLTVVVDAINGVVVPTYAKVSVHTLGGAAVGNNLSTLGKGTYIVTVKRADGTMKTVKVTK